MQVKLLLFGEAVNIPKTNLGLGVNFVSVWMDGNGFTSASNSMGSLGYIFLETEWVDIGSLPDDKQGLFANLHGRTVTFSINPSTFFKDGGNARIAMVISVQQDGGLVDQKIEFQATSCRGVCLVSNALNFTCEMLEMEKKLAMDDTNPVLSDDAVAMAVDNAPKDDPGSTIDTPPSANA
jgi:hypothetical protein